MKPGFEYKRERYKVKVMNAME